MSGSEIPAATEDKQAWWETIRGARFEGIIAFLHGISLVLLGYYFAPYKYALMTVTFFSGGYLLMIGSDKMSTKEADTWMNVTGKSGLLILITQCILTTIVVGAAVSLHVST